MLIAGVILFVLGLVAAVACFFWRRSSRKDAGWWSSVAEVDVTQALGCEPDTAVAIGGAADAALLDDGTPMVDPLREQQQVAWWRHTVTEHWDERVRVSTSTSSGNNDHRQDQYRWESRSRQISQEVSGRPFTVSAGGAAITIDPAGLDIDGDVLHRMSEQQREGQGDGIAAALVDGLMSMGTGQRNQYVETTVEVLPAGARVLASGRTATDRLIADSECGLQICEGTVADRLGESLRSERRAHLGFVAGLVLTGVGAVVAVAGAAAG